MLAMRRHQFPQKRDFLRKISSSYEPGEENAQVFGCEFYSGGEPVKMRILGNFDCYIYEDCGHVELFAKDLVDKIHALQAEEEANQAKEEKKEEQLKKPFENLLLHGIGARQAKSFDGRRGNLLQGS